VQKIARIEVQIKCTRNCGLRAGVEASLTKLCLAKANRQDSVINCVARTPTPPPDRAAALAAVGLGKIHKIENRTKSVYFFTRWVLHRHDRGCHPRQMALKTSTRGDRKITGKCLGWCFFN
jgi:hypothetical protein